MSRFFVDYINWMHGHQILLNSMPLGRPSKISTYAIDSTNNKAKWDDVLISKSQALQTLYHVFIV